MGTQDAADSTPALPAEVASPGSIRSMIVTLWPSRWSDKAQATPTMPAPTTQTPPAPTDTTAPAPDSTPIDETKPPHEPPTGAAIPSDTPTPGQRPPPAAPPPPPTEDKPPPQ